MVMTFIGGWGMSFRLSPADEATYFALRNYREQLAAATGVRHPDHETYEFHLTLAYQLQQLTEDEVADYRALRDDLAHTMRSEISIFEANTPLLTFFDDMFRFVPEAARYTLASRRSDG
jgi:hypothetical protein